MTVRRPPAQRPATHDARLGGLRAPLVVWAGWLVVMAGANLATPLYAVYAERFGFSSLVLTAIFATYAFVLVPALILFGTLSDRFGRRPVMLAGLATACGGLVLFAFAESSAWLFAARAAQGLAVGMISGAATAALVELDPDGDRRRAALLAGLAQAAGSSAGPLLAGVLAQWAPAPLRLSFVAGLVLTAAAAALMLTLPEPAAGASGSWHVQLPQVPSAIRSAFARVSLTAATVWASMALFFSIVPSYAAALLHSHNLALLAAVAAVSLITSSAAQSVARRRRSARGASVGVDQGVGLVVLTAGLLALIAAAPLHSLAALVAGSIAAGAGHGLAFLNAQQELNDIAPPEHRGEVTAAFVSCIYFLVATAVISTGLLDLRFSLSLSVGIVSAGLIVCALATAAWQFAAAGR
jgi:MFS family permease